ncbi:hypothetical protein [Pseudooceanicola nanhaiensis]|uniref:hypothetical protein n=1 Tax=Pseudooceanicola nanhaiensis TaxID=375761 RepID=UPI001CD42DF4|nr:hypothetical protein [Pseudooceanicola nanhaiensis]MCA0919477.1 hypothetical protein [Pseudooceanicola nanhaiensis]
MSLHEGDMLHLADIVLRMHMGQVPHLDFTTPLGGWGFQPMVFLADMGFPLGKAMVWSQILVALILLPAIGWVALSRFGPALALAFGLGEVMLITGLIHGETAAAVSLSMHYNRWAWAIGFLVAVMVLLPPRAGEDARSVRIDGVLIGLAMAALAMIKVTYCLALAVPALIMLPVLGRVRVLLWALGVSFAVLAVVAVVEGPAYWIGYANDLLGTTQSARKYPGPPFAGVVFSPAYTAGTAAAVAAVILLARQAQTRNMARGAFLFVAGFIVITWQNFGTDPYWLAFLALFLAALIEREAVPGKGALAGVALVALTLFTPVLLNLAWSPLRHVLADAGDYRPLSETHGEVAGIYLLRERSEAAKAERVLIETGEPEVTEFEGRSLPACAYKGSIVTLTETELKQLADMGLTGGPQPLVADLVSPHWIVSDFTPLPGGAPWTYVGAPGLAAAGHLMVPLCAIDGRVQARVLEAVEESGRTLSLVGETQLFLLYRIE